jgi:signal transduction histidine kinase
MSRSGDKNSAPSSAERTSGAGISELLQLIEHRLREPLGPALLVLQLLLREESLSPQGIDLVRMLQRSIKEEVRAMGELLTIMRTFLEQRSNQTPEQKPVSKNRDRGDRPSVETMSG